MASQYVPIEISSKLTLDGDIALPAEPHGIVVFAHGSGSGRHSPRNRQVAHYLRTIGLASLLVDLLTPAEDEEDRRTRRLRFDIAMLARRLVGTTQWLGRLRTLVQLPVGYFGASTGAAAALVAAAIDPERIAAVVSRGGRPDLAGDALRSVRAPTLLLVGSADDAVLQVNERALARLRAPARLEVIAGAGHLFEEPGALDQVAAHSGRWFLEHFAADARADEHA